MQIKDDIYGAFEITEPVLIQLMQSASIQRLRGISQYGIPKEFYHIAEDFSRFDHSVGVMLLLKKLGASLEEQVAGLLHDVSHTAFSHMIDWVVGNMDKEDFQDRNHKDIILKSEIPGILANFGIDLDRITNYKAHTLLEREIPDACVDRFDYAVREAHYWANPSIVKPCLESLLVHEARIVFGSKEPAEQFARTFMKCQLEHWGGIETVVRYFLFSKMLQTALRKSIITFEDFYKDDQFVIEKIRKANDHEINVTLKLLSGRIKYELTENNPQIVGKKKFRYLDPEYFGNGKLLYRLSETDKDYKEFIEKHKAENEKGIKVNLLVL